MKKKFKKIVKWENGEWPMLILITSLALVIEITAYISESMSQAIIGFCVIMLFVFIIKTVYETRREVHWEEIK